MAGDGRTEGKARGYSGTPLAQKLGIKPGHVVLIDGAPAGWRDGWPSGLGTLPDTAVVRVGLRSRSADMVIGFFDRSARLRQRLPTLKARIPTDGTVWLAWPKKAAGVPTDLSDGVVRALGLAAGLVDVKVCAIDATWSGLKFVYRLKDRG